MENKANESLGKINGSLNELQSKAMLAERSLEQMTRNAGEKLGTMASDIAKNATNKAEASRNYIKENPVKGAAIAAGVGLVAGSLITMIMSRRK